MLRLFIIKASVLIWRCSINISDRLSPAAWRFLTCCSIAWLILSFGGIKLSTGDEPSAGSDLVSFPSAQVELIAGPQLKSGSPLNPYTRFDSIAANLACLSLAATGEQIISVTSQNELFSPFKKFMREVPLVIVQIPTPESNASLKSLLFWVSLFGMIVSPITSMATILLTWISLHRKRAYEILLRQKLELEIQQLQMALEKSGSEVKEQKPSLIVVTN